MRNTAAGRRTAIVADPLGNGARAAAEAGTAAAGGARRHFAAVSEPADRPGQLRIENGTLEAIKWLALLLMTGDHINKYALGDGSAVLFAFGRLVMPLFGFVLAYNLARPGAADSGMYGRLAKRLAIFGAISSPAFIALGGVVDGWWPLNIFFTLLVTTACAWCFFEGGGWQRKLLGLAVLAIGGSSVEFWWAAIMMDLALVGWFKSGGRAWWMAVAVAAAFLLWPVNHDEWALAAFPLMLAAPHIKLRIPRIRWAFYAYYPALLYALLAWRWTA